ncbi:WD40 repeat-like protein [Saitoella complicata NRRL Y-17804]|nr:WD40 repeat-like protein [Saitoella complicata NRRL Y-17804]ODQ55210.1 WD40 repeat-like protein [Saitoella complicata NRRL Y-17804]
MASPALNRLKAHKAPVLSLAFAPSSSDTVASSSEDCTLRLWDLRTEKPVKAWLPNTFGADTVTSIVWSERDEGSIWVGCGTRVLGLDVRGGSGMLGGKPVVEKEVAGDEINQIALHGDLIAAADDLGDIYVWDTKADTVSSMKTNHTSIASTLLFIPHKPTPTILSGGLDSQIMHWDLTRKLPKSNLNIRDLIVEAAEGDASGQMFNPPFVNSLSLNEEGKVWAAAVGDGSVFVGRQGQDDGARGGKKRKWNEEAWEITALGGEPHRAGASVVEWAKFDPTRLVSGGNDGSVRIWDASRAFEQGEQEEEGATALVETLELGEGKKVNWLTTTERSGKGRVVIADTSGDILLYDLRG